MKLFEYDEHIGDFRVLVQHHDLERNAISGRHIAPAAVTNDKIAPGAVGMEQLAPEAVDELSMLEEELAGLISEAREKIAEARRLAAEIAEMKGTINEDLQEILTYMLKGGYKAVAVNQDIVSEEQPAVGTEVDVIYVNGSQHERTVTIPLSSYKTSTGEDLVLIVPVGGYAEANFVNVGGTIYVRGM